MIFRTLQQCIMMDALAHSYVAAKEADERKKKAEEQRKELDRLNKVLDSARQDRKRFNCTAEDAEFEECE